MKIRESNLKVHTESGEIHTVVQYVLSPEKGYILKNKITGLTVKNFIVVGSKNEINNYIEKKK